MKKIVIVGGGTAGWMSAMIMAKAWISKGFTIQVLESPDVGIIGVGEGSTPTLKTFFDNMDIAESEWMPECNATYKCGIAFDGWSTKPGFESYFHPFSSFIDKHTLSGFMRNVQGRLRGLKLETQPDKFFLTAQLAAHNLAPKPHHNFPFGVFYGYHFDAVLLGVFLRKKAIERGVQHYVCHVQDVQLNAQGEIAALVTKDDEVIAGDFFVDCTGFTSLLLQKTLQTPFKSFANNLFNDAAVALPSEISSTIPSYTLSTALKNGWAWKIPLTNRFGNGYVYSSQFCSAQEAEHELRAHLGLLEADVPVRHLKMIVGQVEQHWNKNCLAVGLSQGFIEPLEATALYLVQQTAEIFVEGYEKGNFSNQHCAAFNQRIGEYFEGIRDYIVTHYKTSSRTDTEYWRANTADQTAVSDAMKLLYSAWMSGKDLADEIHRLRIGQYYPAPSWYCILAGMGIFPSPDRLREPLPEELGENMQNMDDFLARCRLNFDDHRQALDAMKLSSITY
jgi:tryptophan 6-halogenase